MSEGLSAKPVTLTDVARRAGVSVPTASRVLNGGVRGKESGSPALRRRVKEAARDLGYSVSTAAQTIKDGRSRTVALLVTDIDDFGAATMIAGVMHAAERRGVSLAVRATLDDARREVELLTALRGERPRAVIMATSRTTDSVRESALDAELQTLREQGSSVVLIGDSELDYPRVTVDNRSAAAALARAFAGTGARRFAVLTGPADELTARDRALGFIDGLREAGIEISEEAVVHTDFSRDGGYMAVHRLGDLIHEVDVIAAMSDAMAVGAIAGLRRRGVSMPGDVEVSGFDHVPMLADLLPDFSTVDVPLERFGEAALALAIDDVDSATKVVALHATPILRGVRIGERFAYAQT